MTERAYVLGTDDEEIERLGVQHGVWREWMLSAWRRAGIASGARVIDVGAGPGFATVDLADLVGPSGAVLGVERSSRFAAAARRRCAGRGLENVRIEEVDLMLDPIPAAPPFDAAWCRWVACFVSSPERLLGSISSALRPGGVAVFHEYGDYASWRLMPPREAMPRFVDAVMASWRAAGGEPDVGLKLPALLGETGFRVRHIRPLVFTVGPADALWRWPAAFLQSAADRLSRQGYLSAVDAAAIAEALHELERDASAVMMTPLVLEIIAAKSS
jgi:SAM-dependent methyltransferase